MYYIILYIMLHCIVIVLYYVMLCFRYVILNEEINEWMDELKNELLFK